MLRDEIDTIPIIGVNDDLVTDEKKPTQIMSMFFTIVHHAIDKLSKLAVEEAPKDGKMYARKDGQWVQI